MKAKKPTTNSKPGRNANRRGTRCEHILFPLLHTAIVKAGTKLTEGGKNTKEYSVLVRLKSVPVAKKATLSKVQTERLSIFIKALGQHFSGKLKEVWERVAHKDSAALENDGTVVDSYLRHIGERIQTVRRDPILHRRALAAQARCLEFECRWEELVTTLLEIIRIEETQLKDPVEAARTRTRTAEAYIEQAEDTSLAKAKALLLAGIKGIESNSKVWRTRLELLLSLARVHLRLGEYAECQELLIKQCRPRLQQLRTGVNAGCFPELAANYEVRLGVALKGLCREMSKRGGLTTSNARTEYTKDLNEARTRLIAGALLRAKLRHFFGTAHAIRHLGGIYALSDWGLEPQKGLPRALWFYRAAMAVFHNHGDKTNEARTHFNCGKVSWRMWRKITNLNESQQSDALKSFGDSIGQAFDGEEAELVTEIQSSYDSPHMSSGDYPFARPYRFAAIAHYEAYLKAKEGHPETAYVREAKQHVAELNGTAGVSADTDGP